MEQSKKRRRRAAKATSSASATVHGGEAQASVVSEIDLASLGGGQIAYIRELTGKEARARFPSARGLPKGSNFFVLSDADGTPIALTDSWQAALGHASEVELEVASVH